MTHDEDRQNLIAERENLQEESRTRESDIEELNAEISELKTALHEKNRLLYEEIKELKETNLRFLGQIANQATTIGKYQKKKTDKICPFMSAGSVVTACRTDCRMWFKDELGGFCSIQESSMNIARSTLE